MTEESVPEADLPRLGFAKMLLDQDGDKTPLDKIIAMILDPANISHNTELSADEVTAFSFLSMLSTRHNLPALQKFLQENLIKRVSLKRKGKGELIKILNRAATMEEQQFLAMNGGGGRRSWYRR